MVGHLFVAQGTWVRFPVAAQKNAPVAQWIEYLASNQGAAGSNPAGRTDVIFLKYLAPIPMYLYTIFSFSPTDHLSLARNHNVSST